MLGSTCLGAELVADALAGLTPDERRGYLEGIVDHGERLMRDAIRELPDAVHTGRSGYDNDCF